MAGWRGGGVCPVPEDDGASRHVAIDAFAQTIGSALGPFWHDGVVHPKPVPRDLIVAASKATPAQASGPAPSLASNADKVCIPGLTTTREVCPRCSASLTVVLQRRSVRCIIMADPQRLLKHHFAKQCTPCNTLSTECASSGAVPLKHDCAC